VRMQPRCRSDAPGEWLCAAIMQDSAPQYTVEYRAFFYRLWCAANLGRPSPSSLWVTRRIAPEFKGSR
jgi:hypothetical protein